MRAGHLDHLGAQLDQRLDRLAEGGDHARLVALAGELLDHAEPHPGQVAGRAEPGRARPRRAPAAGIDVESRGSWPAMTACSSAASSTVRAHGPGLSSEDENAISP